MNARLQSPTPDSKRACGKVQQKSRSDDADGTGDGLQDPNRTVHVVLDEWATLGKEVKQLSL